MIELPRVLVLVAAATLLAQPVPAGGVDETAGVSQVVLTPEEARQRLDQLKARAEARRAEIQRPEEDRLQAYAAGRQAREDGRGRGDRGEPAPGPPPRPARPPAPASSPGSPAPGACDPAPVLGICPCYGQEQATAWVAAQVGFAADPACELRNAGWDHYGWDSGDAINSTGDRIVSLTVDGYCYSRRLGRYLPASGYLFAEEQEFRSGSTQVQGGACAVYDRTTSLYTYLTLPADQAADCLAMLRNANLAAGRH